MDRANNTLKVKISGKNRQGESFEEIAQLENFGSFGMLIYTSQSLKLSDVMHICGLNGKPLASAEVVWVRSGGERPAVEVLLHRNLDLSELASNISAAVPAAGGTMPLSAAGVGATSALTKPPSSEAAKTAANSGNAKFAGGETRPLSAPSLSSNTADSETTDSSESILCSSCNKPNPIDSRSCKHCGGYLSRGMASGSVSRAAIDKAKSAGNSLPVSSLNNSITGSGNSQSSSQNNSLSGNSASTTIRDESISARRSQRESTASAPKPPTTKAGRASAAQNKAELNSLQQFRKIAVAAVVILTILLVASFVPSGLLGTARATPFDVVQQTGCIEINNLKRQANTGVANSTGDLEIWTQADNGAVQFIRREITAGNAVLEIDKILTQPGIKLHGCWCPKFNSKPATTDTAQMPGILALPWVLKPVGTNAATQNELTLQFNNPALTIKEKVNQNTIDRTNDIKQATYYTGMQKIVLKLSDTSTNVSGAVIKELTFYLPSSQDPVAAAEGLLSNTVHPYYLAQPNGSASSSSSIIFILQLIMGFGLLVALFYLLLNFNRMRKLQ